MFFNSDWAWLALLSNITSYQKRWNLNRPKCRRSMKEKTHWGMRAIVLETTGSMSIYKTNMGFVRERLSFRTHWTGENRINALIGILVLLHPMSWRYLCNETLTIRDKKQSAFCVHMIFWHAGKRESGWFAPQLSCYSVFSMAVVAIHQIFGIRVIIRTTPKTVS